MERGVAFVVSGKAEPIPSADEGIYEKRGDAVVFAGFAAGGLALATLYQFILKIPVGLPDLRLR